MTERRRSQAPAVTVELRRAKTPFGSTMAQFARERGVENALFGLDIAS